MVSGKKSMFRKVDKLFIPFITAGDPNEEASIELALSLEKCGADSIELGVPYSDPLADGPVIQRASIRARKNGMNIEKTMELAFKMKKRGLKIPIILFTYYNPVLQLGENHFFALMEKNQIEGLLIPDLPFEESEELRKKCEEHGIYFISMVAPTSQARVKKIAENASGFLYCVSSLGVTGERQSFDEHIQDFLRQVKQYASVPVAVGFGISTNEHVKKFSELSDGVIIGSAIIRQIEKLEPLLTNPETKQKGLEEFEGFIADLLH